MLSNSARSGPRNSQMACISVGQLIGLAGTRPEAPEACAAALANALEGDVEHRDHENPDRTGGDHSGEHRCADVVAADLACTLCHDQRIDAEDEGEGGHHHRAEPTTRAEHRGFADVHTL